METNRPLLLPGLQMALRHWRAIAWTYALQLLLTILFTFGVHHQIAALLSQSLVSARLTSGFDVALLADVSRGIRQPPYAGQQQWYLSSIVFAVINFILTPGVLYAYVTGERACLHRLQYQGFRYFWRFVRIALVAVVIFAAVLGPLGALRSFLSDRLDTAGVLGKPHFLAVLPMTLLLLLFACLLRLYFDLVEVYTIRLGLNNEHRVYKAYAPAWNALRSRFTAPYLAFSLLTFTGVACIAAAAWLAIHRLAAPGSLGIFLLLQSGILLDLVTRFWQRALEVRLAEDAPENDLGLNQDPLTPVPISPWPRPYPFPSTQTHPEPETSES
ncbi:hypothetical protein [Terriglobus albidus]|uniref:hypothetical protein n=1 Tax=Terriglobus albidus TaxID=1592106 RepID=UPI0021E0E81E|nr:hypothetical protein [Terriglobus albidus]